MISLSTGTGIPFSSFFTPTACALALSGHFRANSPGSDGARREATWLQQWLVVETYWNGNKQVGFHPPQLWIEPIKVGICLEIFVWNESWRHGKMEDLWPKIKIICKVVAPVWNNPKKKQIAWLTRNFLPEKENRRAASQNQNLLWLICFEVWTREADSGWLPSSCRPCRHVLCVVEKVVQF